MGIALSKSFRNDQVRPKKVVDPTVDWPEWAKDLVRELNRECNAIAGSKEGDTEEEADARFCEFMRRGACKEAYTAFEDCVEKTGSVSKCRERSSLLFKCMYSHPDDYQPLLTAAEAAQQRINKEIDAFIATARAQGIEIICSNGHYFVVEGQTFISISS